MPAFATVRLPTVAADSSSQALNVAALHFELPRSDTVQLLLLCDSTQDTDSMSMLLCGQSRVHTRYVRPSRPACHRLLTRAVAATEAAPKQIAKPAPHGRLYNFAAGPAVLPVEVLEEAQADLLNWKGSGTSVMEMSHRGKEFSKIIQQAEDDLRQLLKIPDNYQVHC